MSAIPRGIKRVPYAALGIAMRKVMGDSVRLAGQWIDVPAHSVRDHTRSRIALRRYERDEIGLVRRYLRPELPVIELGVGVGIVGTVIRTKLDAGVQYVGVEANPQLVELAEQNIRSYAPDSSTQVLNGLASGLKTHSGTGRFLIDDHNFHASRSGLAEGSESVVHGVEVPIRSLSDLVSGAAIDSFQLVADIEGAELDLVLHDGEAFEKCKLIVAELHPAQDGDDAYEPDDIASLIVELGFTMVEERNHVFCFQRP